MKLYIPPKVLAGEVESNIVGLEAWPYNDGQGDPFWVGGMNPKPYRWAISVTVDEYDHSSHLTRSPGVYNGIDVNVGDWVASRATGTAVKVIGINAKTEARVDLVVEDVNRYNTFRSSTGDGLFPVPSTVIIFELNQDDLPVIDPVPAGGTGANFTTNLMSRFQNFTGENNVVIAQESHGLQTGDVVALDTTNNRFTKASSDNRLVVGRITTEGPGPNYFIFDPVTTVMTFDYLEGIVGDVLYMSADGQGVTLTDTGIPVYVKLQDQTNTSVLGTKSTGTTAGNIIIINGVPVTIGGTGTISDVVTAINGLAGQHKVTSSVEFGVNEASTTEAFSYGEPAAFITNSPQISINGITVTFSSTAVARQTYPAQSGLALEEDMAVDINSANIPNITAGGKDNTLTITNTTGGEIEILNLTNDANGSPMLSPSAGTTSCTGIVAGIYAATTERFVRIEGPDAGEIALKNDPNNGGGTENVLDDLGIYTVENGQKAKALYVVNGVRKAESFVVDTNLQRQAITNVYNGDTVFVKDSGNSEWAFWIYAEDAWEIVATEDSARTDADTITVTLDSNMSGTVYIGTVSDGSRVSNVTVDVIIPVDDINAVLNIGDDIDNARLMSDSIIDMTQKGTYTFTPSHVYNKGGDVNLNAYFDPAASTQGQIKVVISYA